MFVAHLGIKGAQDKPERHGEPPMQPFTKLTGIAAPLPMVNVDTDKIIPAKWLKTIKRTGLGVALFETLRYREDGSESDDFVLNREPYRRAEILIVGENFGCGSSREHAPWALLDFGIRCVIGPSFADIFFNNCFKNGILPVVLPQEQVDILMREASEAEDPTFTIDLEKQEIHRPTGNEVITFEVDPFARHCLLNGLDDVGLTMKKRQRIDDFEARQRAAQPWLYPEVA
jgi:3-isopropylmalate/(R)-2-methylmalate dehydratase small subunit